MTFRELVFELKWIVSGIEYNRFDGLDCELPQGWCDEINQLEGLCRRYEEEKGG